MRAGIRIDCRGAGFVAGFTTLLQGVTLAAYPGECVGLLGPSGAGKSTLLKLLNGYAAPSNGQVLYNGRSLAEAYDELKPDIGYVPQDDLVHPSLTPYEELWYAALLRMGPHADEKAVEERVRRVLAVTDMTERADTRIRRLSGGQRKRVSTGVELLTEPPVLFLDEPTSGLDPSLESKMMQLFKGLASQGRTVVLTTHIMDSLDALDLVAVLARGRLVFVGPPREAPRHFGVPSFHDVYGALEKREAAEWESLFKGSALHEKYVVGRARGGPDPGKLREAWEKARATEAPEAPAAPAAAPAAAALPPLPGPPSSEKPVAAGAATSVDDDFEKLKKELGL